MNKRALISILLTLSVTLGILLAMGLTASAAEYDLWIKGVLVTDDNKDDVLGDGIVRYDSEDRILYLYGDISSGHSGTNGVIGETIIRSEIDGMTIDVMKDSHLGMFNTYGKDPEAVIILEGDTTIKGNGELNLNARGYWLAMGIDNMIYLKNADLVIEHMTLRINQVEDGNNYGIRCLDGNVKIIASELYSHGFSGAIFCKNGEISIDGCMITSPGGVNNKNGEIRDSSDHIVSDIIISKTTHKVTSNALNVREGPGTDYSRIGGLLLDKEVVVLETQGEWSKIVYGTGFGWVQSKYLELIEAPTVLTNPFEDIFETDDYYDAVLWAYYADPQITNGMDETHFGPGLTVTRGQAVTFLWRSQGCPEPSSLYNPFVDVPSTEYYYKPILWAVEKGITKGTTEYSFSPDDTLSTQHIVTFIYRTKNPGMDGWNGEAAAWAADENGKPFGIDIAVNNETDCPRCHVVQFLYWLSK